MVVNRRRVLGGVLAGSGLLVSGCHTVPAVLRGGEPAVPWPDRDTLGIGLEGYPYPYPVHYLDVTHVAEAPWVDRQAPEWERRARLAYMDVPPDSTQSKGAVLLVHGKNFFGAYWKGVIEALRHEGFRVIVPDLIGWGKSTKPSTLTAASLVTHLRSLIDQLKVDSVAFIGHSTGGLIGMHMARALPERVLRSHLCGCEIHGAQGPSGQREYRGVGRGVRGEDAQGPLHGCTRHRPRTTFGVTGRVRYRSARVLALNAGPPSPLTSPERPGGLWEWPTAWKRTNAAPGARRASSAGTTPLPTCSTSSTTNRPPAQPERRHNGSRLHAALAQLVYQPPRGPLRSSAPQLQQHRLHPDICAHLCLRVRNTRRQIAEQCGSRQYAGSVSTPISRTYPSSLAATRRRVSRCSHSSVPSASTELKWSRAFASTASPSPHIGEVLDTAFNMARAIVVLMTQDEI